MKPTVVGAVAIVHAAVPSLPAVLDLPAKHVPLLGGHGLLIPQAVQGLLQGLFLGKKLPVRNKH